MVVPQGGPKVLAKTMRVISQKDNPNLSSPPVTPATAGRRSVLDNLKFGPGNRQYGEIKEERVTSQYPDLIRALSKERDSSRRRQLFESHRHKIEDTLGTSRPRVEHGETRVSQQ